MCVDSFECAGLTTEGYDAAKGIEVFRGEKDRIWWFRCSKDWMNMDIYRIIILFFFPSEKKKY